MERPIRSHRLQSYNLLKGTVLVHIEQVVLALSSLAVSLLLIRMLAAPEFGLYKLVVGGFTIVTYLASFGLESVVSRFVAEYRATGEYLGINRLVFKAVVIKASALLAIFLLALAFREQLGELFNAKPLFNDYLLVASTFIGFSVLGQLIGGSLLVGYALRHVVAYVRLAAACVQLAGFGIVLSLGMGIGSVVLVMALMGLAQLVAYVLIVAPKLARNAATPASDATGPVSTRQRQLVRFGLYHYFFQGGQVFREFAVDNFVISAFINTTAVAHYGVAIMMPMTLQGFAPGRILSGVMLPELVRRYTLNNSFAELAVWHRLMQKSSQIILTPFLVLSLLLTTEILVPVFGEEYRVSSQATLILLAAVPFQAASYPFYLLAQVINRPDIIIYSTAGGVYNLVLNLVLVPQWGITGAALATASATVLLYLYFHLGFRYLVRFPLSYPWASGGKAVVNAMPLVGASLVARQLGLVHPISLALILLGGVAYLGLNTVNRVFDSQERDLLHRHLKIPARLI